MRTQHPTSGQPSPAPTPSRLSRRSALVYYRQLISTNPLLNWLKGTEYETSFVPFVSINAACIKKTVENFAFFYERGRSSCGI